MKDADKMIESLSKSKFRGGFHLNKKMKDYVNEKGLDVIEKHAYDFINARLRPAYIRNDGKQTPLRQVHPVFIAQHALGFCCRGCLERIYNIPKGRELTNYEVHYIVSTIMKWIYLETKNDK